MNNMNAIPAKVMTELGLAGIQPNSKQGKIQMFRKTSLILFVLLVFCSTAFAVKISELKIPSSITVGNYKLILNGVGFRKKLFIKVYAGALYLKQKESDPKKIIEADEPMAIKMVFVCHEVSSKKLVNAWNEGFEKALGKNIKKLQDKINTFNSFFTQSAKKGDIYDIVYLPEKGVEVYMNSQLKGTVKGIDFKKALFAIWLGEKPADSGLKKKMLGK